MLYEVFLKTKTFRVELDINWKNYFGLKLGGARNFKVANINGYGVFISDIKPDSAAEWFCKYNFNIRGYQIVKCGGINTTYSTINEIKILKQKTRTTLIIYIKYNKTLLKQYNYI